jgi:hypothetical protein
MTADLKVLGQLIDLAFVEMGDRFISALPSPCDKETELIFEAVGRASHCVMQPVSVVVLDHLARCLKLPPGSGRFKDRRPCGFGRRVEPGKIRVPRERGHARDNLGFPARAILRNHRTASS